MTDTVSHLAPPAEVIASVLERRQAAAHDSLAKLIKVAAAIDSRNRQIECLTRFVGSIEAVLVLPPTPSIATYECTEEIPRIGFGARDYFEPRLLQMEQVGQADEHGVAPVVGVAKYRLLGSTGRPAFPRVRGTVASFYAGWAASIEADTQELVLPPVKLLSVETLVKDEPDRWRFSGLAFTNERRRIWLYGNNRILEEGHYADLGHYSGHENDPYGPMAEDAEKILSRVIEPLLLARMSAPQEYAGVDDSRAKKIAASRELIEASLAQPSTSEAVTVY